MLKKTLRDGAPWLALSLCLAVAGCEGSASGPDLGSGALELGNVLLGGEADVVLRTDAEAYAPGASMTLVLEHRGGERVSYNLCVHGLQRRAGESWTTLEFLRICTAHLDVLEPGQTGYGAAGGGAETL